MNKLNLQFALAKVNLEKRTVIGIATAEAADRAGEVCNYESTKKNYQAWGDECAKASDGAKVGNLRAMHSNIAAGNVIKVDFLDDTRQIVIEAEVVDDNEWKKVQKGVYTGFSQGGRYVRKWEGEDGLTHYEAFPTEVSLVDSPCLASATFEVAKADGSTELRKFDAATGVEQAWLAKDGTPHATKDAALRKNADLEAAEAAGAATAALRATLGLATADLDKAEGKKKPTTVDDVDDAGEQQEKVKGENGKAQNAKPKGEPKAPPANAKKFAAPDAMRKSLYDIGRCAGILSDLDWMRASLMSSFESDADADRVAYAKQLVAPIEQLAEWLKGLVDLETSKLTDKFDSAAAKALDVRGADALAKLLPAGAARDELAKLAAAPTDGELLIKAEARAAAFEGQIGELTELMTAVTGRLSKIEAQPAPAKGAVVQLEKGHEQSAGSAARRAPVTDSGALPASYRPADYR